MRYIIATNNDGSFEFDTLTNRPQEYASSFEPIDVVDGKMVVWDEIGNMYHFVATQPPDTVQPGRFLQSVLVGSWDFSKGDPSLTKIAEGQESIVREILLSLSKQIQTEGRSQLSSLTTAELVDLVDRHLSEQ